MRIELKFVGLMLILAGLLFYMSVSAFDASGNNHNAVNLFSDSDRAQLLALDAQAQEMRDRLEYMVFTKERGDALQRLESLLNQQINLRPFAPNYWRELVFAQSDLKVTQTERDWVFRIAIAQLKWNKLERLMLTNRCVLQAANDSSDWYQSCVELLSHLPKEYSQAQLLGILRVDQNAFVSALRRFDVAYSASQNQ